MDEKETKDKDEVPSLRLKIYERIPIPDLPVNTSDTAKSVDSLCVSCFFHFISCNFFYLFFRHLLTIFTLF